MLLVVVVWRIVEVTSYNCKTNLVGILEDEVFALIELHAHVNDAAQNTPRIVHVQVDLLSKLHWFELLRAQDDVLSGVLDIGTRNISTHIPV